MNEEKDFVLSRTGLSGKDCAMVRRELCSIADGLYRLANSDIGTLTDAHGQMLSLRKKLELEAERVNRILRLQRDEVGFCITNGFPVEDILTFEKGGLRCDKCKYYAIRVGEENTPYCEIDSDVPNLFTVPWGDCPTFEKEESYE